MRVQLSGIQRPRPKLELALPYATYRLTRADGAPLERTDKHPFCMSRCFSSPSVQTTFSLSFGVCKTKRGVTGFIPCCSAVLEECTPPS